MALSHSKKKIAMSNGFFVYQRIGGQKIFTCVSGGVHEHPDGPEGTTCTINTFFEIFLCRLNTVSARKSCTGNLYSLQIERWLNLRAMKS